MTDHLYDRRKLIGGGAAALVMAALSQRVSARTPERRLAFSNPHNGERHEACYFSNGRYRADGLAELDHALRDWRTGEVRHMDPKLLDLLVHVRDRLDVSPHKPLKLISGYRCPKTNRALHARSHAVASICWVRPPTSPFPAWRYTACAMLHCHCGEAGSAITRTTALFMLTPDECVIGADRASACIGTPRILSLTWLPAVVQQAF